jgi:hypothetical protein
MATVITSITGLQNLINLINFNADYNSLTTVNLSGLTNLLFVDISDNDKLDFSGNSLTSVNLSGCTALQTLRLDDSDFSAGIPNLAGLTSLTNLDMDQCSITGNVDLSMLPALVEFDLSGNNGLTSVNIIDQQPLRYINLYDTAITEASVNDILETLDNNGIEDGNVDLESGTSAAPTGAGATAATNLQAKAWSVNVNEPSYYSYDVSNVFNGSGPGDACLAEQTIVLYANTNDPLNSLVGNFLYTDTALTTKFTGNPPGIGGYYRYGLTGDPITYRSDFVGNGTIMNVIEC